MGGKPNRIRLWLEEKAVRKEDASCSRGAVTSALSTATQKLIKLRGRRRKTVC